MSSRPIVLVAEDDPGISKMITLLLESEGYDVVTASDGRECLRLVGTIMPQVLLLDMRLPVLTGEDVMRELTASGERARTKVILASASSRLAELAAELGADGYLNKPFDIDDLVRAVDVAARAMC